MAPTVSVSVRLCGRYSTRDNGSPRTAILCLSTKLGLIYVVPFHRHANYWDVTYCMENLVKQHRRSLRKSESHLGHMDPSGVGGYTGCNSCFYTRILSYQGDYERHPQQYDGPIMRE